MKRTLLLTLFLIILSVGSAPATEKAPPLPTAQTKCPVCGMFVAKYPAWLSAIGCRDGTVLYFDGPKDLAAYLLDLGRYAPVRKRADIISIWVKDYYSVTFVDGEQAYYVIGSNVYGPMGEELVPFRKRADAEEFLRDHKGKRILRLREVTRETIRSAR